MLDRTQPLLKKGAEPLHNFRPISIVAKQTDASRCHLVRRLVSAQGTLCSMGTQPFPQKGAKPPTFRPTSIVPNGCMDQDATWPTRYCVRWGLSSPPKLAQPHQFSANVRCGQGAGWMTTPLGTEVDLGPGSIVIDGVSALGARGTAAPLFSAYVYCGHGRPSQLLLSSCLF